MNDFLNSEVFWAVLIITVIILLIPAIIFLIYFQNTLKLIKPDNRHMEPGEVWYIFIPFYNIYWQFAMVSRLARSFADEFSDRKIEVKAALPTNDIGKAYVILNLAAIIPTIGGLFRLGGFICWIFIGLK
jgi:heme/copper-type cytochrome/quinol oxidase subunit 2